MTSKIYARSHSIIHFPLRATVAGPLQTCSFSSPWKAKEFAAITTPSPGLNPGMASNTQDTGLVAKWERNMASTMQSDSSNVRDFSCQSIQSMQHSPSTLSLLRSRAGLFTTCSSWVPSSLQSRATLCARFFCLLATFSFFMDFFSFLSDHPSSDLTDRMLLSNLVGLCCER